MFEFRLLQIQLADSEVQFHLFSPGQHSLGRFTHINQIYRNANLLIYTNKNIVAKVKQNTHVS